MDNAKLLRNSYYKWIKSGISFDDLQDGYVSISTPFIDENYDSINIYAKVKNNNLIHLSDFGFTLFNLEAIGIKIESSYKVRWHIFQSILETFAVNFDSFSGSLYIDTDLTNFPTAKIRLMQAILHVQDISYLNRHNVKKSFNDIIEKYLTKK